MGSDPGATPAVERKTAVTAPTIVSGRRSSRRVAVPAIARGSGVRPGFAQAGFRRRGELVPFPARRMAGRGRHWYRGDCHVHSARSSDGVLSLEQLAAEARKSELDFIAVTEHNTPVAHGALDKLVDAHLLVILGQEVTTLSGHWLALGIDPGQLIDWRYSIRDNEIDRHLERVRRVGGLCVAAHPYAPYPSGAFEYPLEKFDVVEVWNGQWTSDLPWNADNEAALVAWSRSLAADTHDGVWRPAMGNSDAHLEGQIGRPHSVVLADELSAEAILAALRAGRSWIAGSAEIDLSFEAFACGHHAGIGEQLRCSDKPAVLRVEVCGVPSGGIDFYTDRGKVHHIVLPSDGSGSAEWCTTFRESAYVRIEVRHAGGRMAALTNPISLTGAPFVPERAFAGVNAP